MLDGKKVLGVVHAGVWIYQLGMKLIEEVMPDVKVLTICDDTIQSEFSRLGEVPPHNYYKFATHVRFLQDAGADLVVLGCSTMNRAKHYAQPLVDIPILQIDAPMAEKAVEIGEKIGLLATLKTTVPSSSRLIYEKAEERGKQVEVKQVLCNEAYEKLRGGDVEGHDRLLLAEIDRLSESVDVVVMAQLSMAAMEEKVSQFKVPVLTSGRLGFQRAKNILDALQPSYGRER